MHVATTELNTRESIDAFVAALERLS